MMQSLLENCPEGLGPMNPALAFEFTLCFTNLILANIPRVSLIAYGIGRIIYLFSYQSQSVTAGWLYYLKTIGLIAIGVAQFYTVAPESSLFLASCAVIVAFILSHLEHLRSRLSSTSLILFYLSVYFSLVHFFFRVWLSLGSKFDLYWFVICGILRLDWCFLLKLGYCVWWLSSKWSKSRKVNAFH